jgi:hypothetical protein
MYKSLSVYALFDNMKIIKVRSIGQSPCWRLFKPSIFFIASIFTAAQPYFQLKAISFFKSKNIIDNGQRF